jgi:hypothetical protein
MQTSLCTSPRNCFICHDPNLPLVSGLSEGRYKELESEQLPDYNAKDDNTLRAALRRRGVDPDELTGKDEYVGRLLHERGSTRRESV